MSSSRRNERRAEPRRNYQRGQDLKAPCWCGLGVAANLHASEETLQNRISAVSRAVPAKSTPRLDRPARRNHNRGMSEPTVPREELQSAIEARKELGAELEPALVDSFVERIEQRLVERDEQQERALRRKRDHQKEMVLGAMALGIPLMAIAAIFTGLAGVIVVAAAIVAVAIVTAR
jgi:hypothetical protein